MSPMSRRYLDWFRSQSSSQRQAQIELAASIMRSASEAQPEPHSLHVIRNSLRESGQPEEPRQERITT